MTKKTESEKQNIESRKKKQEIGFYNTKVVCVCVCVALLVYYGFHWNLIFNFLYL